MLAVTPGQVPQIQETSPMRRRIKTATANQAPIGLVQAGEWFGELEIFDENPIRKFTAKVISPSVKVYS